MKLRFFSIIVFLVISTGIVKCQVSETDAPQVLEDLFNRLVDNYNDKDRIQINDSIIMIIDSYVKSDSALTQKFTNLRFLGQIVSPDSLLKIISWNLILENEPSRYYCYFIRKEDPGKHNKVFKLSTTYNGNKIETDTIYTGKNWYGALYYDIRPYIIGNRHYWILLGIDYGNASVTRKVIEVLSFSPDDSVIFGRKWFASGEEIKYREVFEYSSEAMMTLRFGSEGSVIFDHLVPFSPSYLNNHQYYGPDYSLDGYYFENDLWKLKINVDVKIGE
jgi:hypothetical protein